MRLPATPDVCFALIGMVMLCVVEGALAQQAAVDHSVVLKLGPAFERNQQDNASSTGATIAAESTVVENWLEIEIGLARLRSSTAREDSIDFIFKKPFRLSPTAEAMVGVGPSIGRRYASGSSSDTRSIQLDLDFMFWPSPSVGWYLEPTYGYGVGPTRGERSIAVSTGVLFGF